MDSEAKVPIRATGYRHPGWVSASRELQIEGTKSMGRSRKTWNVCVKVDMKKPGLINDDARNWDMGEIWQPETVQHCVGAEMRG